MNNLKEFNKEEIIKLVLEGKVKESDLTDSGICPTCFDNENNYILFGSKEDKILYEDELFMCFLAGKPRAIGHTIINTKKHYKDMMEADDKILEKLFVLAKKVMQTLKEVYNAESIYMCTMCDGPMNHFHIQLIPRYIYEKRGSKNFVKERKVYQEDKEKINNLRKKLN